MSFSSAPGIHVPDDFNAEFIVREEDMQRQPPYAHENQPRPDPAALAEEPCTGFPGLPI